MSAIDIQKQMSESAVISRGGGTLERRKGVYIVHLRGSYADMGRQHALLASEVCGDVVPQYFNRVVENLVGHSAPALAGTVGWALKWLFHFRNRVRIGENVRSHIGAFANVFGVPPVVVERIFLVPDIIHWLIGKALKPMAAPPSCSGFFAKDSATQDGKLLIGRNFDFFGRGVWNTNNAAIFMHPDNGQSYCWMGALGVPGSGQGINESGLMISLHTKFNSDVQTAGIPLFKLCFDVMAECKDLESAIARITAEPRMCGLTMFVSDTKARDAAAVGFSAHHAEIVRPENDVLVRTNHYVTEDMKRFQIAPHPWVQNTQARFRRVSEVLAEKRGTLRPEDIPVVMSDCVDPYEQRKRVTGSIVAAANNSQCVAVSPDDDSIWFGVGDYPVCQTDQFSGFRLSALFAEDRDNYDIPDLPGAGRLDETERAALEEYEQAWSDYGDNLNGDMAVFHLRRAAEILPDEPIFPRMAGIILLAEKKFEQALPLLLKNIEYDYKCDLMRAESHVWAGRCLDCMGRRAEAVAQYEKAAALDAPPVSTAAAKHVHKPFKKGELFNVSAEFITATGMARY